MKLWNRILVVLIILFFTLPVFSENIIFSLMQNPDAYENSDKATVKFEEYIFNYFFEGGFIVGNIPLITVDKAEYDNLDAVKSTLENPTEYVLLVYFSYDKKPSYSSKEQLKFANLKSVEWSLVNYKTEKSICKKKFKIKKSKSEKDLYKTLNNLAKNIFKTVAREIR